MSMTQVAFLKKAELPTKSKIEECICSLGYDFRIHSDLESIYGLNGFACTLNGYETYFEIYYNEVSEITNEYSWIKSDLTNQDIAISFVWGADLAAGACIGLISIALIDNCNALIYYLDDEMKYSREMLLNDTPDFLLELDKQKKSDIMFQKSISKAPSDNNESNSFWKRLKDIFR